MHGAVPEEHTTRAFSMSSLVSLIMDKVLEVPAQVLAEILTQKVTKFIKDILTTGGMEQDLKALNWLIPYPTKWILLFLLNKIVSVAYNWVDMKFFKNKSIYIFEKMGNELTEVIVA